MPKLVSLSSKKINSVEHRIDVEDAKKMVERHNQRIKSPVENLPGNKTPETKSVWFSKEVFETIFNSNRNVNGIRIYFGSHIPELNGGRDNARNKDKTCVILVGTKHEVWDIPNRGNVDVNVDMISDDDKMAIPLLFQNDDDDDDIIYDLGTMCPPSCEGTKL